MQGAELSVSFCPRPLCMAMFAGYVGIAPQQKGESAFRGSPCRPPSGGHYSSRRRRPARRTARVSASLSRTWSSGSASPNTVAWSGLRSGTWRERQCPITAKTATQRLEHCNFIHNWTKLISPPLPPSQPTPDPPFLKFIFRYFMSNTRLL